MNNLTALKDIEAENRALKDALLHTTDVLSELISLMRETDQRLLKLESELELMIKTTRAVL